MGRAPCCSKVGMQRGPWTHQEDEALKQYVKFHGEGSWRNLPKNAGLHRCGKSCRLRWMNYLRPDIKRGNISPDEEDLIIRLHKLLGNRWSLIAGRLPGRTDNEIKNYWNSHLSKKLKQEQKPKCKLTKKKQELKSTETEIEATHTIHTPKPTRFSRTTIVTQSSEGSDCKNISSTSEDKGDASVEIFDIDWSSLEEGGRVLGDQDVGFSHFNDGSDLLVEDNSFGNLYVEYSQLLRLDIDELHMFPNHETCRIE